MMLIMMTVVLDDAEADVDIDAEVECNTAV
jgi:hypothetical protein